MRIPLELLPIRVSLDHVASFKMDELGGYKCERVPSDKVGFDWINEYVGNTLVKQTYVPAENPAGTAENPIPYSEGLKLIQNAYYTYNGVRKVWFGASGVTASWEDEKFAEF